MEVHGPVPGGGAVGAGVPEEEELVVVQAGLQAGEEPGGRGGVGQLAPVLVLRGPEGRVDNRLELITMECSKDKI